MCGFAGAGVRGGEELDGVVWVEEFAETVPGFASLGPSFLGELYAVVGDVLVDVSVLLAEVSRSSKCCLFTS